MDSFTRDDLEKIRARVRKLNEEAIRRISGRIRQVRESGGKQTTAQKELYQDIRLGKYDDSGGRNHGAPVDAGFKKWLESDCGRRSIRQAAAKCRELKEVRAEQKRETRKKMKNWIGK